MAKKRSILKTLVIALLIIAVMLNLTTLPVTANATSHENQSSLGVVTATLLNVRNKPSTDSNVIGGLKKGTFLTIEEVITTSDTLYRNWLKINYNGKVGYVANNYVDFIDTDQDKNQTTPDFEQENYIGIVTAAGLNLRTKPNTNKVLIIDFFIFLSFLNLFF